MPRRSSTTGPSAEQDAVRLRLVLLRLARRLRSYGSGDVTPSQFALLSSVARHGPSTVGQLAEYEHVQAPSASKIVAALEQLGFVERAADPDDRRTATITLTSDGRDFLAGVRATGVSWLADRIAALPADDAHRVHEALPALESLLAEPE